MFFISVASLTALFLLYLIFQSLLSGIYEQGSNDVLAGTFTLTGSTIKCMLVTGYTPNFTTDNHYSDISAHEISGTGYSAGGATVTGMTLTKTAANSWATSQAANTAYTLNQLAIPSGGNTYLYAATIVGTSGGNVTPTAGTNASPIVVTAAAHGLATGNTVTISGVTGNTNMNGTFLVEVLSSSTYNLVNPATLALINGNGTFGGTVTFSVGWPTAIGDTVTDGTVQWTNVGRSVITVTCTTPTWSTATLSATGAVFYYSSGTGSTSTLYAYLDFGGTVISTAATFTVTVPTQGIAFYVQ